MAVKRRRSVTATTLAFSLVLSAVRAAPPADDGEHPSARHDEVYRRRLARSAAEAFAHWTPHLVARAIPLDLKIDPEDDTVYIAGEDGFMTSYAEAFAGGRGADVSSEYWDHILHAEDLILGDSDSGRAKSGGNVIERLYPQLPQEDEKISSPALRGRDDHERRRLDGKDVLIHLDTLEFSAVEDKSSTEADEEPAFDFEFEPDDDEADFLEVEEGRALQWKTQTPGQGSRPVARNARKNGGINNNSSNNARAKKKRLPRMNNMKPERGALVRNKATFSAKVMPSSMTKSQIENVFFTLTDGNGKESAALTMPQVSNNEFAISIDGFEKFLGTRWRYKIDAIDKKGRKKSSGQTVFRIAGVGDSSTGFASGGSSSSTNNNKDDEKEEEEEEEDRPLRQENVRDSDWPHGGHIQSSVGRILFEFDGSAPFVCSGTVIMDSSSGRSPSSNNGRSVIQTAAHCAYNDVLKMFATKAIFIPDQASTTGFKSDFNCDNDRLGCWHLAFAVVEKGWATGSFPENVEVSSFDFRLGSSPSIFAVLYCSCLSWEGFPIVLIGFSRLSSFSVLTAV